MSAMYSTISLPYNFLKQAPRREHSEQSGCWALRPPKRMAFHVRSSKFRHVYGFPSKKEQCYECVKISKNAHDTNCCAVNPKHIAIITESAGGGAFVVLPLEKTGRIDINSPKVCGHSGPVLDIKWNPFNDDIIASCSDDATVKLWLIPPGGLKTNLTEWLVDLHGHQRRVGYIEWHPTAENILLSAGYDYRCIVWNTETAEPINIITVHHDTIFSIAWNSDGSLFATTCKDKRIRIIDPRLGTVVIEGAGHQGSKASKVLFLGYKNRIFTTGFSRMSERQYAIWDTQNLGEPLKIDTIDSSSGVMLPYYDRDTGVVFLAGKGDGNIRYFEIVNEPPYSHFLSQYQSGSPQRGLGMLPKRGIDPSRCEIVRFFKLHTVKNLVEPISMIVPRKSEMFQEDIFPPTASSCPSLTADEWLGGQNREPILISLKDGALSHTPTITTYKAVKRPSQDNTNRQHSMSPSPIKMSVTDKLPASLQNIRKLSEATRDETDLNGHGRVTASPDRSTLFQTTRMTNTNQPMQVDKKVWSAGYTMAYSNDKTPVNGTPNTNPESFCATPARQGAAPATPCRGQPCHTTTPFYSAVADVVQRVDDPTSSSPAGCRLFSDASDVYQTPPTSPSRELFKTSPARALSRTDSDWYRNPLYGNNTLTDSTLETTPSYAAPFNRTRSVTPTNRPRFDNPSVDTPVSRRPLDTSLKDVRTSPVDTSVDTRALDDILQDIVWCSPNSGGGGQHSTRSSSFGHKMSDPSPVLQPNVGRSNGKHRHRHSITLCTQDEIACPGVDSDWISADASDNTLVKPSKLRGSFRSRRSCSREKDMSASENHLQRVGQAAYPESSKENIQLRDTDRIASKSSNVLTPSVMSHSNNGQSRDMARSPFEPHETARSRSRSMYHRASDVSLGSAASFLEDLSSHGLTRDDHRDVSVTPESSVHQKAWLRKPSLETSDDDLRKGHVKKVWSPKLASPLSPSPHIHNGVPSTDPELRKAYFRQVEEITSLKEQLALRDKRIRQLEKELQEMNTGNNGMGESIC